MLYVPLNRIITFSLLGFLIAFYSCCVDGASYINPVVNDNCPDPGAILTVGSKYYVVSTSGTDADAFPIRVSSDLVNWTQIGYVFPQAQRPHWAVTDFWAPEIHMINGKFFVFFAARDTTGILCVGVGISSSGEASGPYTDPLGAPLVRNATMGNIDPSAYYDTTSNKYYLLYKEDGNGHNPMLPTPIWMQELDPSTVSTRGPRFKLIGNDLPWEGALVEAPWMIKRGSYYYLFYSANYAPQYAVGVARSTNLTSGFVKQQTPVIKSNSIFIGTGHCSVVNVPASKDDLVILYHSYYKQSGGPRVMLLDSVRWSDDGWPVVNDGTPSTTPQPYPF
eukprot:TRINITY_DN4532_c0_g1_i3.p1 TRINITY_DN4532_c0_g1~~TRINITY_DN4532_c0_g1_i3.p1  ORF type:complete len:335 (+),score=21.85 TRINITY_DN4532_c0_g1_i3:97-1101(+)